MISNEIQKLSNQIHKEALNKYDPVELLSQAVRLLRDPRYEIEGVDNVLQRLRSISGEVAKAWSRRKEIS